MNYDFLRSYTIPTHISRDMQQPPPPPSGIMDFVSYDAAAAGAGPRDYQMPVQDGAGDCGAAGYPVQQQPYQNINRFIPPGKHGTFVPGQRPQVNRPLKRKFNNGPGAGATAKQEIAETTPDGKLAMFHGRDSSYPDELNKLIRPLICELCNVKSNSVQSAKDHYESKAHDRHISNWLAKNYIEKGLQPPEVKRFVKSGPVGPDAFHCELCDLKLTSVTHASQHYSGRKHRLVASKVSKPSGAGYYNNEGKWVRVGTKLTPTVANDGRFGIGDQFKYEALVEDGAAQASTPDTTTSAEGEAAVDVAAAATTTVAADGTPLHCAVCNISVTSSGQMTLHLEGAKHRKKVKQVASGAPVPPVSPKPKKTLTDDENTILASLSASTGEDLSMYRTPTGSYYCKTCNMSMCHVSALQQHMSGKKHLRKSAEEKAANKGAAASAAVKSI